MKSLWSWATEPRKLTFHCWQSAWWHHHGLLTFAHFWLAFPSSQADPGWVDDLVCLFQAKKLNGWWSVQQWWWCLHVLLLDGTAFNSCVNCVQCNRKVRIRSCVEMGQFWIIWNLGASVKLFLTNKIGVWPCHDYIHIILDTVSNSELARYHFVVCSLPCLPCMWGMVKVGQSR